MLGLILSVVYLFLGFFIGVFVYSNMVLPLLWLPYVIIKIIKKDLRVSAIMFCIIPPIIWCLLLLIIGIIDTFLFKNFIMNVVSTNTFATGNILALIITILNAYSKTARIEFKENLNNYIKF